MYLLQVLLRSDDITKSATRGSPYGPSMPPHLVARADRLEVFASDSSDGVTVFYEFRLYRGRLRLATEKISCIQTGEVVNFPAAPAATERATPARTLNTTPRSHDMKLANADAIQQAITTINTLSTLVGRHCYGAEPEDADAAQRSGVAAIRRLRELKDELEAASKETPSGSQAPAGDAAIAA